MPTQHEWAVAETPFHIHAKRRTAQGRAELERQGRLHADHRVNSDSHRAFIGWDGEGITYRDGDAQSFVLFGASDGTFIKGPDLASRDCLQTILAVERENPDAIHVAFAFDYDVNMILRDMPHPLLRKMMAENVVQWGQYRVEYFKGKWFRVSSGPKHDRISATIYDIFSFFGTSFVNACREYLGDDDVLQRMALTKSERNSFQYSELGEKIIPYWREELAYLVRLAEQLRTYLGGAGITVSQWHGPGAVASAVLKREGIRDHKADTPEAVNDAAQFAFAGGRFEQFRMGIYDGPVYQYDINSAYPNAIQYLPSLQNGHWDHRMRPDVDDLSSFTLCRITFDVNGFLVSSMAKDPGFIHPPMPFFYRDERHCIHYPGYVQGWYWLPEVQAAMAGPFAAGVTIHEAWEWVDDGSEPFSFVADMYRQRQEWKRGGNPAQLALKLALNSMYGKTAQRVGHNKETGAPPQWHQLEWAGYVTSSCRAAIYAAMSLCAPGEVIAVETDGIFTTRPLPLPVGKGLGEWDASEYEGICYVQSGVYYTKSHGSWDKAKTRGFNVGAVPFSAVREYLRTHNVFGPGLTGRVTRFHGMRTGLNNGNWRKWLPQDRELSWGFDGKRVHRPFQCVGCWNAGKLSDHLHHLHIKSPGGNSVRHSLPWKDNATPNQFQQFDADDAIYLA